MPKKEMWEMQVKDEELERGPFSDELMKTSRELVTQLWQDN